MTTSTETVLTVVGAALAFLGALAALGALIRLKHRMTRAVRYTRWWLTTAATWMFLSLLFAAVVTAVQWAVVTHTHEPGALAVALGLPALFAGAGMLRVFTGGDLW